MKKFRLSPITKEDIEFIYFLRSISKDNVLKKSNRIENSKFLNQIMSQGNCGYFKYECDTEIVGYYRFYSVNGNMEIGSWITNPSSSPTEKILFDLEFKKQVFNLTGQEYIYFDVRKHNFSVWKHHERFGAEFIKEDVLNRYYKLNKEIYNHKYHEKIDRINKRTV